jgi:hypothetical protein
MSTLSLSRGGHGGYTFQEKLAGASISIVPCQSLHRLCDAILIMKFFHQLTSNDAAAINQPEEGKRLLLGFSQNYHGVANFGASQLFKILNTKPTTSLRFYRTLCSSIPSSIPSVNLISCVHMYRISIPFCV